MNRPVLVEEKMYNKQDESQNNADEQREIIRKAVGSDLSDDEFEQFIHMCEKTGLDPLSRQIYAIKRNRRRGNQYVSEMTVQTGIDGFRLIAARTGKYMGSDEPEFEYNGNSQVPAKCKVTIYKSVNGTRCSFTGVVFWKEFYPGNNGGSMFWDRMPHTMLEKVAEAKALRKAFPAELSGLYEASEMHQAENGTGNEAFNNDNRNSQKKEQPQQTSVKQPEKQTNQKEEKQVSYGELLWNFFLSRGIKERKDQLKIIQTITERDKQRYNEAEKKIVYTTLTENPDLIRKILEGDKLAAKHKTLFQGLCVGKIENHLIDKFARFITNNYGTEEVDWEAGYNELKKNPDEWIRLFASADDEF
jgi:phage recombination protein Bet